MAGFVIKHAMYFLPADYMPSLPYKSRSILYAFQHAFQIYKSDIKTLVEEAVGKEIEEDLLSHDLRLRAYAVERKTALEQWLQIKEPFGYSNDAYPLLVKAIRSTARHLAEGLPLSHIGQTSILWFSEQLLDTVKKSKARIQPPLWKAGRAFMVFQFAVQEAESLLGISGDDQASKNSILPLLSKAASLAKICNIPWSPNPTGAAGRPISTVQHTAWINLGKANPINRIANEDPSALALSQATQAALAQDSQAEWNCIGLTIQNMHSILNRQTLPIEWNISKMTFGFGQ